MTLTVFFQKMAVKVKTMEIILNPLLKQGHEENKWHPLVNSTSV